MIIVPDNDRLLVLVEDTKKTTESGFNMGEDSNNKMAVGEVVATSVGEYVVGSKVMFQKFSAVDVRHKGQAMQLIQQKDIVATIEDEEKS